MRGFNSGQDDREQRRDEPRLFCEGEFLRRR